MQAPAVPTVSVTLDSRSYEVFVEPGILDRAGEAIAATGLQGRVAIVTDTNVAPHLADRLMASLNGAGYEATTHLVPAGEGSKSMKQTEEVCRSLIMGKHDRSSFVVALGGGVVGDLAGFVAAIFFRGIPFVQIPTTIVSQVDSSVGGKTGVNTPEGKNLLGAFHQPRLVLVDPETLSTLPDRSYHEGFAEVIKHAAIRDEAMLADLEAFDPANRSPSPDLLARNIAIKARIVEEDERETGGTRALLNFGHTIGHAIEASVPYGQLLHGEAISLGMRAALFLSEKVAGLAAGDSARIIALLKHFHLPLVLPPTVHDEAVITHMARDKNFAGGARKFVVLEKAGAATISTAVTEDLVHEALQLLRQDVA